MPLIKTTLEHIEYLVENLKPDHQREIAWFGVRSKQRIRDDIAALGDTAMTAVHDGKVLFIAGINNDSAIAQNSSVVFCLSTTDFDRYPADGLQLMRYAHEFYALVFSKHNRLMQYLPPPYSTGIRFLEKLGWTNGGVVSVGATQAVHMYLDVA